jgi:hypothetical protein
LANNEVNEGYKDRQDPAITIKFPLLAEGDIVDVAACIIKRDNKFLMLYHKK